MEDYEAESEVGEAQGVTQEQTKGTPFLHSLPELGMAESKGPELRRAGYAHREETLEDSE